MSTAMLKFALTPALALAASVVGSAAFAEGLPGVTDGPGPNLVIEVADAAGAPKGKIVLDLYADKAPKHVERIVALAKSGAYDNVVFHRVIDGFMAQTGDVQYGKKDGETSRAGMGGSELPDLKAEFNDVAFQAGTVGMARSQDPNSANSQFFIDLAPAEFLNGQYTVVGQLIDGWDVLNAVKKGDAAANGSVDKPDVMVKVTVQE
ncbi:peptidylprolyl isomerase [Paracoccus sp. (in: a-proteobacteria)]|uniref:peptidylprolyl isomerase n=1 Tax=Paracoccus sp. TaxID=267 RepID=UPI0028A1B700|nr:peptidylprolyl isomerase [Paracoccus sp. (in: a-proteobacteria)]